MIIAFMLSTMTQGKAINFVALLNALGAISVCVAIVLWSLACVRLLQRSQEPKRASDQLCVIAFALQLLVPIAAVLFHHVDGTLGSWLLFSLEASLSFMTIVWASRSRSIIGNRMKAATLLWFFGVLLAVGTPQI